MRQLLFIWVLPIAIIVFGLILAKKTELIRDDSISEHKPYSLARTQLLWWSMIIISCYSIYYGCSGLLPELDNTLLVLLGISGGTTATARIIDNTEIANGVKRHQDNRNHKHEFFNNILSDNNGISIHRFQTFIFNVIFGLMFLVVFFESGMTEFADFDTVELGLMGISSAAYVGLKFTENSGAGPKNDDNLRDIDEEFSATLGNGQNVMG